MVTVLDTEIIPQDETPYGVPCAFDYIIRTLIGGEKTSKGTLAFYCLCVTHFLYMFVLFNTYV